MQRFINGKIYRCFQKNEQSAYGTWTAHFSKLKSQIHEIDVLVFLIFMIVTAWDLAQDEQSFLLISAIKPPELLRINFRKKPKRT